MKNKQWIIRYYFISDGQSHFLYSVRKSTVQVQIILQQYAVGLYGKANVVVCHNTREVEFSFYPNSNSEN